MKPPIGKWRLVAPAEDASSAREYAGALVWQAFVDAGKALGLRLTWDERGQKLYLGLPRAVVAGAKTAKQLLVPVWYSQRDSKIVIAGENQGARMCFSTSCAMILKTRKPGALTDSPNADDEYLQRVFRYGDTTEASAQLSALRFFGIKATFATSLSCDELDAHLAAGGLAALGVLHRGHVSRPTGGGHYVLAYAKEGDGYRVHDPYGEMDLVNGGYLHADGRSRRYSRKNLGARWLIEGPESGWALLVA